MPVLDRKELEESPLSDLHAIASELGIEGYRRLRRDELIDALAGDGGGEDSATSQEDDEEPKPKRRRTRRIDLDQVVLGDSGSTGVSRVQSTDSAPAHRAMLKRHRIPHRNEADACGAQLLAQALGGGRVD